MVVSMEQKPGSLIKDQTKKTMHKVAEEHNVGYVTVGNWKKKRSEIK